jgi:hypothetical protein
MRLNYKSLYRAFTPSGTPGQQCYIKAACVALILYSSLTCTISMASDKQPTCGLRIADGPMYITNECIDPLFNQPVIDVDEWRDTPVRHRYVNGHFSGTGSRFSFYFPPIDKFKGRFFQTTHQLLMSENADPGSIAFAIASGGYAVQSFPGPKERITSVAEAFEGRDPSLGGYRVNAAAAKFSRTLAAKMYGDRRIYGYISGGSGGSFQVVASLQNSSGVWDGGVPYVMGSPQAMPNVFTVRIHALRVLKNKFPQIMDAIDPGGSGDMYAGLNKEEQGALREATLMGFPPRGWFDYPTLNGGPLTLVAGYVPKLDPTYVDDFWTKPGYLGTDPESSIGKARIQHDTDIVSVTTTGPMTQIKLSSKPDEDLTGADLVITSGAAAGESIALFDLSSFGLVPATQPGQSVPLADKDIVSASGMFGSDPSVIASLKTGDRVRVDNSWYLAMQTYHRHQVPTPDYYAWDEFRGKDGRPVYPQRKVLIGPISAFNGAGSIQDGTFNGKMIVIENLMDIDALSWQADWYRTKVHEAGRAKDFRLYYIDHADHVGRPNGSRAARLVDYSGALQQALLDLSAWVEQDVPPPAETHYTVVDSQIKVPPTAEHRLGFEPVVELKVNGSDRADVKAGQKVTFHARIEVPPDTGKIILAEWDFMGAGDYPVTENFSKPEPAVDFEKTYTFSKPGTYFPVLRATSQREGNSDTPFTRIQNLGRVRVVVK